MASPSRRDPAFLHRGDSVAAADLDRCLPRQVWDLDLQAMGAKFEKNAVFPAKTNTEFVEVVSRDHVKMRVWERGAGERSQAVCLRARGPGFEALSPLALRTGITLACGTGACATVVAGVLEGRLDRKARVDLPGGPLIIEWRESNNRIYMTGPAQLVFAGSVSV